jgi:hypothetical protein
MEKLSLSMEPSGLVQVRVIFRNLIDSFQIEIKIKTITGKRCDYAILPLGILN